VDRAAAWGPVRVADGYSAIYHGGALLLDADDPARC
jgi:hypothetical protein